MNAKSILRRTLSWLVLLGMMPPMIVLSMPAPAIHADEKITEIEYEYKISDAVKSLRSIADMLSLTDKEKSLLNVDGADEVTIADAVLILKGCAGEYIPVTEVFFTYNYDVLNASYPNTTILAYSIIPKNATDRSVSFSSSDENVLAVNEKGEVKFVSLGATDIKVTANDGGFYDVFNMKAELYMAKDIPWIKNIVMNVGDFKIMDFKEEFKINLDNLIFEWSIMKFSRTEKPDPDYKSIATVNSEGRVDALSEGICPVYAYCTNYGSREALTVVYCIYVVNAPEFGDWRSIEPLAYFSMDMGKTKFVLPASLKNQEFKWRSSNEDIVKVNEDNSITCLVKTGAVLLRAYNSDGWLDEMYVIACEDENISRLPLVY